MSTMNPATLTELEQIRGAHRADLERLPVVVEELQAILDRSRARFRRCDKLRREAQRAGQLAAFDSIPFPATPPRVDLQVGPRERSMAEVWIR